MTSVLDTAGWVGHSIAKTGIGKKKVGFGNGLFFAASGRKCGETAKVEAAGSRSG